MKYTYSGKQTVKLTCTFLNKTYLPHSRKLVNVSEGNSYTYYGATKKDCEKQARDRYRWNGYKRSFESVKIKAN